MSPSPDPPPLPERAALDASGVAAVDRDALVSDALAIDALAIDALAIDAWGIDAWGRAIIGADDLVALLYNAVDPADLHVLADERVADYNRWCATFDKRPAMIPPLAMPPMAPEVAHAARAARWFIPAAYDDLDVRAALLDRCASSAARARIMLEMDLFEARDLLPILRLMLALVDYFRRDGIVWGVGRGSSCASYALFLIGVHKVDALRYDLDIHEFLKP